MLGMPRDASVPCPVVPFPSRTPQQRRGRKRRPAAVPPLCRARRWPRHADQGWSGEGVQALVGPIAPQPAGRLPPCSGHRKVHARRVPAPPSRRRRASPRGLKGSPRRRGGRGRSHTGVVRSGFDAEVRGVRPLARVVPRQEGVASPAVYMKTPRVGQPTRRNRWPQGYAASAATLGQVARRG